MPHETDKKNLIIIILVIVIFLMVISGIFLWSFNAGEHLRSNGTATSTASTSSEPFAIKPTSLNETNNQARYTITVSYPEVVGLANKDAQVVINRTIKEQMQAIVDDFKKSSNDVVVGTDNSTLDVNYVQEQNASISNILSFRFNEAYFEAGAAHPGETIETFNFDSTTGKVITLADLFNSNTKYIERISIISQDLIKKKLGYNDPQIKQGAAPEASNFSAFLITETGLKIIFNEYQVAPSAAGAVEIVIPYTELKDFINPKGPLKTVL